jgi:hypothetical protein
MWRQFTLVVSIKDKGLDGGNDDGRALKQLLVMQTSISYMFVRS